MLSLLVVVVEGETFQDGADIDSYKGENSFVIDVDDDDDEVLLLFMMLLLLLMMMMRVSQDLPSYSAGNRSGPSSEYQPVLES